MQQVLLLGNQKIVVQKQLPDVVYVAHDISPEILYLIEESLLMKYNMKYL